MKNKNLSFFIADLLSWVPDPLLLKLLYRFKLGKKLNLKNPRTFNEKLQLLKLYNRKSEYTTIVDKYLVKKYVAEKIADNVSLGANVNIIGGVHIGNNVSIGQIRL